MSQPPSYGPPPPGYQDPPHRAAPGRRRLPWFLAVGGILATAIVVTLVLTLTGGPDRDTARGVAEGVVDAFNDNDLQDLVELSCQDATETLADLVDRLDGSGPGTDRFEATAELDDVSTAQEGDEHADARIELTITNVPAELAASFDEGATDRVSVTLGKEDGTWCVTGLSG